MKWAVWLVLAAPWILAADEAADRAAIDKLISAFKEARAQANGRTADLLAPDADQAEFNRELAALDAGMVDPSKGVWTEVGPVAIVISSVRFLTPDIALVDGSSVRIGSVMIRRVGFLLIARRENTAWKIAVLRTLANPPVQMKLQLVQARSPQ